MANYNTLISAIQSVIAANGNNEITGPVLQQTLLSIVDSLGTGYQFIGIATPETTPGTPDQRVFYIGSAGTYPNFGPAVIPDGNLGIFYYDSSWHYDLLEFPMGTIQTSNIANEAITTPKIANEAITTPKIADEAITEQKLSTNLQEAIKHPVSTENENMADLDICDNVGNVLVRFADGHIQTKYFDSRDLAFNVLAKFKNKKIAIIGDSISTYQGWLPSNIAGYDGATYAYYYPRGDVDSVQKTWWYKVAKKLGLSDADINNCAWSGSYVTTTGSVNSDSTTNAKPGCSTRRISDLAIKGWNPDIVLIFISCNDWGTNVPVGSWAVSDAIPADGSITTLRSAYALMLNKIHVAYPQARIFCCTNLDDYARDASAGWPSNNAGGVTTYQWNQNIIEIATAFGCDVINLHECGINYSNIASLAVDTGLHPNAAGMELMANKVFAELIAKY